MISQTSKNCATDYARNIVKQVSTRNINVPARGLGTMYSDMIKYTITAK